VVATANRGNYPLVNFEAPGGRIRDWFPPVLALSGDRSVYGWEGLELHGRPDWTIIRSLKRWLKDAGPHSEIDIAGQRINLSLVTTEMMAALRRELLDSSTLGADKSDKLQVICNFLAKVRNHCELCAHIVRHTTSAIFATSSVSIWTNTISLRVRSAIGAKFAWPLTLICEIPQTFGINPCVILPRNRATWSKKSTLATQTAI
jgi:hypothetical protein